MANVTFENQSAIGKQLRVPIHHWYNSDVETKAIVVAIPGLVFAGRAYDTLARGITPKGYEVYSVDMRGYGDWIKQPGDFDGDTLVHFGQSKDDISHLLSALRDKHPGKPIYCLGESFGANYAVWEACTEPKLLDGVIACGLSYKIAVHPRPRWFLTFAQGLSRPRTPMDLKPYLEPILSDDKAITLEALKDPDTMRALSATDLIKAGITTKKCIRDVQNIPPAMPVLIIAGAKDEIQKTRRLPEFISTMGSKHARLVVLPNKGHLLFERKDIDPDVSELVESFLDRESKRYAPSITSVTPSTVPAASPVIPPTSQEVTPTPSVVPASLTQPAASSEPAAASAPVVLETSHQ